MWRGLNNNVSYFSRHRERGVTAYFIAGKKPKISREDGVFLLFFAVMAVFYGYRMFTVVPWYDELYTYYYFISRGPVYAAIHWPLPNNHVGYSTLSACLGIFGSAPIALRGVSYLCSLGSLILLYRISKKWFDDGLALVPVFLFAGMNMVNQLAVQGRGYALVTFCYLAAILSLHHLIVEKSDNKRNYIVFGLSLVIALWAIPSSLYMVMPVCLIGGLVLLLDRDFGRLIRLIITSLVSAVCTAGIYCLLWLAIGSNLITKIEDMPFYQGRHIDVIIHRPFWALTEGMEYMLATPYIQSMTRQEFNRQAGHWLRTLFGEQLFPIANLGGLLGGGMCFLLVFGLIAAAVCLVRRPKKAFSEWYFVLTAVLLGAALVIQCKLPYQRVFSFLGVWAALLVGWLLQRTAVLVQGDLAIRWRVRAAKAVKILMYLAAGLSWAFVLATGDAPYSMRDELLADAYEQTIIEETDTVAVTDCDQEYLLLYLYGIGEERVTRDIRAADIVVLDKAQLNLPYDYREGPEEWKFYLSAAEVAAQADYMEENMEQIYENWQFVLLQRKKARTE